MEPSKVATITVNAFDLDDQQTVELRLGEGSAVPWGDLGNDEHEALCLIVQLALWRLARDPSRWLPEHLRARSPGRFGLTLTFTMDDVNAMVTSMLMREVRQTESKVDDLMRIASRTGHEGLAADL